MTTGPIRCPDRWRAKRLKFAAEQKGRKISSANTDLPYVGLEHIESWTGQLYLDEEASSESTVCQFDVGDVMFGKLRPYLAKVHLAEFAGVCTTEALVLGPGVDYYAAYLRYLVVSNDVIDRIDSSTYGSKMPRANWHDIGNLVLPVPEKEEQQTIARFLDYRTAQLDALIEKKRQLLDKLAEKRSALITRAVTQGLDPDAPMKDSGVPWLGEIPAHWETTRCKFLITEITSGSRGWAKYYSDSGAKFIRIGNLSGEDIRLSQTELRYLEPPDNAEASRTTASEGDILVSITALIGAVSVVPKGFGEAYVNQHIALLRPSVEQVRSDFLAYYLASKAGQAALTSNQYGGTKDGLGFEEIKDVVVPSPQLSDQDELLLLIDHELTIMAELRERIELAIERLTEYRSALVTAAVTGQIDVRGWRAPETSAP